MKTQINPVNAAMGIFRVAIRTTDADGAHTWHRHRGTRASCIEFCTRFGVEYVVNDR